MGVFLFIFGLLAYALSSFFLMKIFDKAGVEGKWRAWVPVYNMMVFSKLGDVSPWLILIATGGGIVLGAIPILNLLAPLLSLAAAAVFVAAAWRVGMKLQKEPVWLILAILLTIVWLGILAFDKSTWNKNIAPSPWAGKKFLEDDTVWEGVPSQSTPAAPPAAA